MDSVALVLVWLAIFILSWVSLTFLFWFASLTFGGGFISFLFLPVVAGLVAVALATWVTAKFSSVREPK